MGQVIYIQSKMPFVRRPQLPAPVMKLNESPQHMIFKAATGLFYQVLVILLTVMLACLQ